jgi:hypothetical protein
MTIKKEISFDKNPMQEPALSMMLNHKFSLLYGGGRAGKTFIILFLILIRATKRKSRHAILRFRLSHLEQSIIHDTFPKVAELMGIKYKINSQKYFISLSNGSEIWYGGLDDKERVDKILGNEYNTIFLNEASQISYHAYTTVLTRLSQRVVKTDKDGKPLIGDDGEEETVENRMIIDENPPSKAHWTYKLFFDKIEPKEGTLVKNPDKYGVIKMNPEHNLHYIGKDYMETLDNMPKDYRRRFKDGDFADIILGSLFTEKNIAKNRINRKDLPELKETVIGVDPGVSSEEGADETGIIVVGKGYDGRGYILDDQSDVYTPKQWADKVCELYIQYNCTWVIAEKNQGGEMVSHTIHTANENIPVKLEHAKDGKRLRASPASALYEKNKISHVGGFPDLEEEMTIFTGSKNEDSPNRLDALVYGVNYLFPVGVNAESEIFHRDNLHYFKEYNFEDGKDLLYIKITSISNRNGFWYNFTGLFVTIKDKKGFIRDVIFNEIMPFDNIESVNNKIKDYNIGTIFVECDKSFLSFGTELRLKTQKRIWQIKEFTKEDNRVLSETGFIRDKIIFQKDIDNISYKNFMQQLHSYTNLSEENESFASSILASLAYAIKKAYNNLI